MTTVIGLHPIITKLLAVLAISATVLGFAWSEPSADSGLKLIPRATMDPLWPDHLRCLVLGAEAADDRICAALLAADREH